MKLVEFKIAGQTLRGYVENIRGTLWVHLGGRIFTYEPPRKASRKARSGAGQPHPGTVVAPMPGKIIKIGIAAGEKVSTHQVLVVLEAMKMEYTLKAQADGVVKSVNCQVGDQVALGQTLVQLEGA